MEFKSNIEFSSFRITPAGIDIKALNVDLSALSVGDWVVYGGSSDFAVQIAAGAGQPGVDCVAGVVLEAISAAGSGWVRIKGKCTAKTGALVVAGEPLMLVAASVTAVLLVPGTVRAGFAFTTSAGGLSTVMVG